MKDDMKLEITEMSHSQELFHLINKNREYLREWLPWVDGVSSVEDTEIFISRTIEQNRMGLGTHHTVFSGGTAAGIVGFHPIDWSNRNAEVGYWLGKDFTGMGLATESVKYLLHIGFGEYDLNRIEIRCASGNKRSIAVAKRLNMIYEGTLREEEWLYNRFVDHVIYSILKKEFSIGAD